MIGFIIGFFIGGMFGFTVMAVLCIAGEEKREEKQKHDGARGKERRTGA